MFTFARVVVVVGAVIVVSGVCASAVLLCAPRPEAARQKGPRASVLCVRASVCLPAESQHKPLASGSTGAVRRTDSEFRTIRVRAFWGGCYQQQTRQQQSVDI